jgi:hypothetical protein
MLSNKPLATGARRKPNRLAIQIASSIDGQRDLAYGQAGNALYDLKLVLAWRHIVQSWLRLE